MISILKYDIIIIKFPFASSLKYKARPAVVISSNFYNENKRDTIFVMAISSSMQNRLNIEQDVEDWKSSGLLKKSLLKASIATIEKKSILTKVGVLSENDKKRVDEMLRVLC